jgi:Zn finger protein HypA/HybF involved in hydrogenase expression
MPAPSAEDLALQQALAAYVDASRPERLEAGDRFVRRCPLLPRNDLRLPSVWVDSAAARLIDMLAAHFPGFQPPILEAAQLQTLARAALDLEGRTLWLIGQRQATSPAHFTLFCQFLLRPFRVQATAEYRALLASFRPARASCPLCGTLPALLVRGDRMEGWCGHCGTSHPLQNPGCPCCGGLEIATVRVQDLDVWVCPKCKRFFKILAGEASLGVDLAYLKTAAVDDELFRRGCVREYPFLPAVPLGPTPS